MSTVGELENAIVTRLSAALTLPVSASARNSRNWRKVMFIDFYL